MTEKQLLRQAKRRLTILVGLFRSGEFGVVVTVV
jgi:hypothetical protein